MDLPTEIFGDVIVVHTPDELSRDAAADFESYVPMLERSRVVLDLDHTEVLDSEGLTAILNAQDTLAGGDGAVKIATTNPTNRKILEITRVDRQVEVFDSVIDAVKSFQ